jgi:photosystem II stability/assembly factor-like uncharacterized protein
MILSSSRWLRRAALPTLLAAALVAAPAFAGSSPHRSSDRELEDAAEGAFEVLEGAAQYAEARTAPADVVDAGAFSGAYADAAALPVAGGPWSEVTTQPYDNDDHGYRDPVFSNSGAGWGLVSGRTTALAVDDGAIYAGMADGGVWKSTNGGANWTPLLDDAPTLSTGSIAIDPADHSVWVGTGEANTSSDSYAGIGVLRSADGGATWTRVGGDELQNHLIGRLAFDDQGHVYAATSQGLYRRSTSDLASPWTLVLKPCIGQHDTTYISDVAIRPGTAGQTVVAVVGWRAGSACNGFYVSNDGGLTFALMSLKGSINESQIGRTTLAYSSTGAKLYAVVQSSKLFNHASTAAGGTVLMGVFVSPQGDPAGSWNKIAEWGKLAGSGSALKLLLGYHPGVQAWYNQFLLVDPNDANHVYLGLEEVFETTDGGTSWKAIGPYWNFGLKCGEANIDNCAPTTHPDQHAIAIAGDTVFVGNDGGVYSRPLHGATGWTNDNATLRSLQYYFASVGKTDGCDAFWGGLQDNGESLLLPGASTMVSPFGGDGGDTLVDPNDADRAVVEYVNLDMALTTNGGRSNGSTEAFREISPSCFAFTYTPSPCDPSPRFIAPFEPDSQDLDHWVAGGRYVWDNGGLGWDTTCSASACDWSIVHDAGVGRSITTVAVNGDVTYAAWCGPCNAPTFLSHIDTNAGGTWHTVSAPNLPNRFVAALTVDPADAAHVYAVYNGFSRRWVQGGGIGHVFESTDGGDTWTDISGDLPDAPSDDLLAVGGHLVLATDIGVFVADAGLGAATAWSRFGTGLPNASTNDLALSPDGDYIVAATHGRGLWMIDTP